MGNASFKNLFGKKQAISVHTWAVSLFLWESTAFAQLSPTLCCSVFPYFTAPLPHNNMNYLFGQQKAPPPPPPPAPPAPPPVDPVEQQRKMEARAQELQGKIEKIDADLQGLKHQFQTPGSNKPIIKQRCAHLMQNRGELNKQLQMVQAGNFSLGRSAWRGGAGQPGRRRRRPVRAAAQNAA